MCVLPHLLSPHPPPQPLWPCLLLWMCTLQFQSAYYPWNFALVLWRLCVAPLVSMCVCVSHHLAQILAMVQDGGCSVLHLWNFRWRVAVLQLESLLWKMSRGSLATDKRIKYRPCVRVLRLLLVFVFSSSPPTTSFNCCIIWLVLI